MMERKLTIAEIILIAGTRVALGAGIGLLVGNRLNNDQRKAAGLALAVVGGLSSAPFRWPSASSARKSALTARHNSQPDSETIGRKTRPR